MRTEAIAAHTLEDVLMWGLPADRIATALSEADGGEIASGKVFSERSSSVLVLNAFGPFFDPSRSARLPPPPSLDHLKWPACRVLPESKLPFPWRGGR